MSRLVVPACSFDADNHAYVIGGVPVPGVTKVLADLVPGWKASEWYLGRGSAVHAAAAFIARGIDFEHDERIAGQVKACRRFFREMEPDVIEVERQVYSRMYRFAGTLDLCAKIQGKKCILDYKSALTATVPYQCAAYALAYEEEEDELVPYGAGVQLGADGFYRMSEIYDLTFYRRKWLVLLGAYNIRRELKVDEPKEESE